MIPKRTMPDDFPTLARTMTVTAACKHWKTDSRRVRNWIDEVGGDLKAVMAENAAFASRNSGSGKSQKYLARLGNFSFQEPVDVRAMKFLQREKRWPVHSSRIYGDKKEIKYHVGSRKLTFDELIATAEQYGFQG